MQGDLIAFYGTLRGTKAPGVERVGPCTMPGKLLDIGAFPGLIHSPTKEDRVVGDLFRLTNTEILDHFDRYEGYREENPESSLYLREMIEVETPDGPDAAWVYVWNGDDNRRVIASGDWFVRSSEATGLAAGLAMAAEAEAEDG